MLTAVLLAAAAMTAPGYAAAADSTLLFHYADAQIDESSGLAASSYGDGIVYTFNDSGDTARFFAVNASGATVAIYTLKGATNHDWEDMDAGTDASGKPVLYFGDIGDNSSKRTEIDVYQVPEPRGPSADVSWIRYRFKYPDGSHNAETLMVDPHTHRIFIASKAGLGEGEGLLYEAPAVLEHDGDQHVGDRRATARDTEPHNLGRHLTRWQAHGSADLLQRLLGSRCQRHVARIPGYRATAGRRDRVHPRRQIHPGRQRRHAYRRLSTPAARGGDRGGRCGRRRASTSPTTKPVPTAKPTVNPTAQPTVKPTVKPTSTTRPTASSNDDARRRKHPYR